MNELENETEAMNGSKPDKAFFLLLGIKKTKSTKIENRTISNPSTYI